eukprot:1196409-Prorocentrum_minimum.AAC.3
MEPGSAGGAQTTITGHLTPSGGLNPVGLSKRCDPVGYVCTIRIPDRRINLIHGAELKTGSKNTAEVPSGSALHSVMKCLRMASIVTLSDVYGGLHHTLRPRHCCARQSVQNVATCVFFPFVSQHASTSKGPNICCHRANSSGTSRQS